MHLLVAAGAPPCLQGLSGLIVRGGCGGTAWRASRLPCGRRCVSRVPSGSRAAVALGWSHAHGMGSEGARRHGRGQMFTCVYCGLPQERVQTIDGDTRMLEPEMRVLAHLVPADRRWIEVSGGQVALYAVCPVDGTQRCRIEHVLACPSQDLPELWPWLATFRQENARKSERLRTEPPLPPGDGQLPDVG